MASGCIADGRGLAAALVLGAAGANIGTRFLASKEAPIKREWKQLILDAVSEDAVKFHGWNQIMPPMKSGGYDTSLRAIRTPYIDYWNEHPTELEGNLESARSELLGAIKAGNQHALVPGAGQSAGLVNEILPAGEIVRQIAAEAEQTLLRGSQIADN